MYTVSATKTIPKNKMGSAPAIYPANTYASATILVAVPPHV
jgi:hypothetical protein